jgi:hypothetical protein
MAFFRSPET